MALWVWRNIRIELPGDWEMLQFSRNADAGRCAWADRYQFRIELSWQAVPGPPDMERLTSDYLSKLRLEGTMADATRADFACGSPPERHARRGAEAAEKMHWDPDRVWWGIRGHQAGGLVSRFTRHFPSERCLVEVVLLWHEGHDASLERSILDSVAPEPERADGLQRWRAFGMDLFASGGLVLYECRVEPALARMAFADERAGRRETFRRLGMVSEWLAGTVADWLAHQRPDGVQWTGSTSTEVAGHRIEAVSGVRKPGLARRASPCAAAAWLCPSDGRLYCVAATGAGTGDGTELAGRRLSCCAAMGMKA